MYGYQNYQNNEISYIGSHHSVPYFKLFILIMIRVRYLVAFGNLEVIN